MLVALILGVFTQACNSDTDSYENLDLSGETAVMVSKFSLKENEKVLTGLDEVFFSIDLNKATVFNADSLPKGTRVNRLPVSITMPSVSKAEITMPGVTCTDTVVDYLSNANDSIDFSRGSVKLKLVSYDGSAERTYTIFVNVHKSEPDSLCWGSVAMSALPTDLSAPTAQKTVLYQGKALTFVQKGSDYTRGVSANPGLGSWDIGAVSMPVDAVIGSLTASGDALFVTTSAQKLYKSGDMGLTWQDTGMEMAHIYGAVDGKVAGVRHVSADKYVHVTYPEGQEHAVPANCPVSGTSDAVIYSTEWSSEKQMIIVGGRTASGALSDGTWGFDGESWAQLSAGGLPNAEGMTLVPYFSFRTGDDWTVIRQTMLLAFGGIDVSHNCVAKVYMSPDRGMHWSEAGQLMQLPEEMSPRAFAQALVFDTELPGISSDVWSEIPAKVLPAWYCPVALSRAVKPIEKWECPYIYLFGGTDADGKLYDTIWRGVINRLSFKPLQ